MIYRERIDSIYRDRNGLQAAVERRSRKRAFYSRDEGVETICDLIRSGHVFDVIDETDPCEAAEHNMVIRMLDDIGLFDEDNLEMTVRYLLSLPVFPERKKDKE